MLDLLLRYVTLRNLVIAGLAAASLPFAVRAAKFSYDAYLHAVYPPVRDNPNAADDIKKLLDQREHEKVLAQYRRVTALISDAKELGYNVGVLSWKTNEAMANDSPGRRDKAMSMLAEIEMITPRKKPQFIPLPPPPHDTMEDEDEAPAAKPVATKTVAKSAVKSPKTRKKVRKARTTGAPAT